MINWYKKKKEETNQYLETLDEDQRKIALKSLKRSLYTTIFFIVIGIALTVLLIISL